MNKRRLLIVSCSIILLCMLSIVGMTFALFTSSVRVTNHLKAGTLDVDLIRTHLDYKILGNDGKFFTDSDPQDYTFSDPTDVTPTTIFGVNYGDLVIVPGTYFEATMKLTSDSNVAYDYSFTFVYHSSKSDADFAKQMFVVVTPAGATAPTEPVCLFDLIEGSANGTIAGGHMAPGASEQEFKIKVYFENFLEGNAQGLDNNDAMDQDVYFDLIVEATQATD